MSTIVAGLSELVAAAELLKLKAPQIAGIAGLYADVLRHGGKLLFAGNGGSAADAQHLAAEYVVRFHAWRKPLAALALTVDTSVLTAIGNDVGFEHVFARQVDALAGPEDLLILHSTSGNSANLVAAAIRAKELRLTVVALLGSTGGKLARFADLALLIPSRTTARIQELQLAVQHLIVEQVEAELKTPSAEGATA
jgi:D-sedoheptulose 7-phosphate isomerase